MANFAEVVDIAAQWRELSSEEETRATALLTRASAIIRARVPGVDDRVDAGALDAEIPKGVAVDMVVRVLKSPKDATRSVTVDDTTFRYATGNEEDRPAELHLTAAEVALLSGRAATRRSGVGTIHVQPTVKP